MKKIIFFGTSDFGIESMNEIIKKYNLISVVTNPDKKIGRGMKITKTKIKIIAEKHNIKVFQPSNLNNTEFINSLKKLNPDLFIVIAFKKLPEERYGKYQYMELSTYTHHYFQNIGEQPQLIGQ